MRILAFVLISALSFSAVAQKQVTSVPDWYKNPPKMEVEKVYGVGKGLSTKMSFADQKAMLSAKENIAFQINPPKKVKKHYKIFFWRKNEPITQETTQTTEQTLTTLKNIEIVEKVYIQRKGGYEVYVLLVIERIN
jgi:hypothetical protein